MIPLIKLLTCVLLLGTGNYKERKQNQHLLSLSPYTYAELKWTKSVIKDPEVLYRLEKVAYLKWVEETAVKYKSDYEDHSDRRDEDFKLDWRR